MEAIYHPEGRITPDGAAFRYEYNIKDHLGNTRLTFADINNNGAVDITGVATTTEILTENHYYPFGMNMGYDWMNNTAISPDTKYQYNGKEYNDDFGLNWNDYGARWYDGSLGRWMSVDKMAENSKQNDKSPFQYGWNNPVKNLDPDGNFPIESIWDAANVVYDIGKIAYGGLTGNNAMVASGTKDLAADALALAIPYVPAGASKVLRAATTVDDVTSAADGAKGKSSGKAAKKDKAATDKVHKNSNDALGDFIIYDIDNYSEADGQGDLLEKLKSGKADDGRKNKEGTPVRMRQSEREAQKTYPNAKAKVVQRLGTTTTRKAKETEAARVRSERAKGNPMPLNKEKDKNYHN